MPDDLSYLAGHTCASCGQRPVGPGGILCPECKTRIATAGPQPASEPPTTATGNPPGSATLDP